MSKTEDADLQRLSNRIAELRKEKGLTQEQISERMEIDDGSYRRIESGRTNPTYKTLVKLCNALNISLETMFEGL